MLSYLKMLLSLRAWLKSRTLNVAAVLGLLATMDLTTGSGMIQHAVDFLAVHLGVMQPTALAFLVALKALADAVLRAKTDKALVAK